MGIEVLDHRPLDIGAAADVITPSIGWDPLEEDSQWDSAARVSHRALTRVAMIAADTGARFQREGIGHDPVAWMLAPRRLFGGKAAIEACLRRDDFLRASIMHGLGIGLDADPDELDELLGDSLTGKSGDDLTGSSVVADKPATSVAELDHPAAAVAGDRDLYTATLVLETPDGVVQAFGAVVAKNASHARNRFAERLGAAECVALQLRRGFDPRDLLAETLLSPVVANMLGQVAQDPALPLGDGLMICVEQRFAA